MTFLIADIAQHRIGHRAVGAFGRLSGREWERRRRGDCALRRGGLRVRVLREPRLGVLRGQQGLLRAHAGEVPAKGHYSSMKGNRKHYSIGGKVM